MSGPYGTAAMVYRDAGWRGVLPLPVESKSPPPKGFTGNDGAWPSSADTQAWCSGDEGSGNIGLRLPVDVIGIDVDAYGDKQGGVTFAALVERHGPLPPTWLSTSRDDGVSGIYLYRVPAGLSWPGEIGPGIEIIQWCHRYAVVWPSVHPEGRTYRWIRSDGVVVLGAPRAVDLTELPPTWITSTTDSAPGAGMSFVMPEGPIPYGQRDTILHNYAWSMLGAGVPKAEALDLMSAMWARCAQPAGDGYPLATAHAKVHRAYLVGDGPPPVTVLDVATLDSAATIDRHAHEVAAEVAKLRVREQAKAIVAAENAGEVVLPTVTALDVFLAEPDPPLAYRIDGLMPSDSRVLFAAPHKVGKTTMDGNLIRSLVDGTPFLDRFDVIRASRVVLIDTEMSARMLRSWMRSQGMKHPERVGIVSLRGRVRSFDILNDASRARWAELIGPADVLLFDCLRPVLDAHGLSEDKDAGKFLVAFDALLAEAGIAEAVLVHHTGHAGERARGDSRLQDWPDVIWKLVADKGSNADVEIVGRGPRYLSAYGRDVEMGETMLAFDPMTRHLTASGGSRNDTKIDSALDDVLAFLAEQDEPLSGRTIEDLMAKSGPTRYEIRAALKRGRSNLQILTEDGPNRSTLHFLTSSGAPVRRGAP
jgi:hypothetical protein